MNQDHRTELGPHEHDEPAVLTPTQARQGRKDYRVWKILAASLVFAVAAGAILLAATGSI